MARKRTTPRQILDALIDLFTPDIRSAFLASVQDVVDNVVINGMITAITNGDVEAAFRTLGFNDAAMRPLTASIERAYERGGVMTGETFPKYLNTASGKAVFRFDVRNSRAEAWLRDHSSSLVARVTDEQRNNVRTVLRDGMERGSNPRTVALDIVGRVDPVTKRRVGGIVGLTEQQAGWVANVRADLNTLDDRYFTRKLRDKRFDGTVAKAIREGKPLDAATVEKLVTRYKDKALKYRGDMIGRTEAIQSLNASEHEATRQAVDMGAAKASQVERDWDATGDKRTRPSHILLDGQKRGLDEPFISPVTGAKMLHPGDTSLGAPASEIIACRCRVRTRIDWLAALD